MIEVPTKEKMELFDPASECEKKVGSFGFMKRQSPKNGELTVGTHLRNIMVTKLAMEVILEGDCLQQIRLSRWFSAIAKTWKSSRSCVQLARSSCRLTSGICCGKSRKHCGILEKGASKEKSSSPCNRTAVPNAALPPTRTLNSNRFQC